MSASSINSQLVQIDSNISHAYYATSEKTAEPYIQKATQEIDQLRQQNLPPEVRHCLDAALNELNEPYSNTSQFHSNLYKAYYDIVDAENNVS